MFAVLGGSACLGKTTRERIQISDSKRFILIFLKLKN
jgi:hypothetical protein